MQSVLWQSVFTRQMRRTHWRWWELQSIRVYRKVMRPLRVVLKIIWQKIYLWIETSFAKKPISVFYFNKTESHMAIKQFDFYSRVDMKLQKQIKNLLLLFCEQKILHNFFSGDSLVILFFVLSKALEVAKLPRSKTYLKKARVIKINFIDCQFMAPLNRNVCRGETFAPGWKEIRSGRFKRLVDNFNLVLFRMSLKDILT
jgi:hypothetical protein